MNGRLRVAATCSLHRSQCMIACAISRVDRAFDLCQCNASNRGVSDAGRARAIEEQMNHNVRIVVYGIDLTDPPLAPTR